MNYWRLRLEPEEDAPLASEELHDLSVSDFLDFPTNSGIHLVFMPGLEKNQDQYVNEGLRNKLVKEFFLPEFFFERLGWNANGLYGSVEVPTSTCSDASYRGCGTFSRFLSKQVHQSASADTSDYTWHYMAFCTLWLKNSDIQQKSRNDPSTSPSSSETHIILCFDLDTNFAEAVMRAFDQTDVAGSQNDPFCLLRVALGTVIDQFEADLDTFRAPTRKIEKERINIIVKPNGPDSNAEVDGEELELLARPYATLHEVSRHVLHISETLSAASNNLAAIIQDQELWMRALEPSLILPNNTARALRLYSNIVSNLKLRADAFVCRMDNEIKCASNLLGVRTLNVTREEFRILQQELFLAYV